MSVLRPFENIYPLVLFLNGKCEDTQRVTSEAVNQTRNKTYGQQKDKQTKNCQQNAIQNMVI